mmetsp:Transcript_36972/g.68237  ORF Transcript_36972/g.68237 Transcript_36972/m.68237 type:complete len:203 (+) Transcript_36972:434-1042(+)
MGFDLVQRLECVPARPFVELPYEARAAVVRSHHERGVGGYRDGSYGTFPVGYELIATRVRCEIPHPYVSVLVPRNYLTLVRMEDGRVESCLARVGTLKPRSLTHVPDFERAILRPCEHPLSVFLKPDRSDISRMAREVSHRHGYVLHDIEQPRVTIPHRGEILLVRSDCQLVYLRVRESKRPVALSRRRLPEFNGVVVARRT